MAVALKDMITFALKHEGEISYYEIDYSFSIGAIDKILRAKPAGAFFKIQVNPDGSPQVVPIDAAIDGWRVCLDGYWLYLSGGSKEDLKDEFSETMLAAHRLLMGMGWYFPKQSDILTYWRAPMGGDERSFTQAREQGELLIGLVNQAPEKPKTALELGSAIGRNLALIQQVYDCAVTGLEINPQAVQVTKELHPNLADANLIEGDLRQSVYELADRSMDLVFSVGVLMHLHPKTEQAFWDKLAKVGSKILITLENETYGSERSWPRNYQEIFGVRGWHQTLHFSPIEGLHDLEGYTLRGFVRANPN